MGDFLIALDITCNRDRQTSLNSCFNACFEMFRRNPAKKWQRLPAAATRQDAAATIWGEPRNLADIVSRACNQ